MGNTTCSFKDDIKIYILYRSIQYININMCVVMYVFMLSYVIDSATMYMSDAQNFLYNFGH